MRGETLKFGFLFGFALLVVSQAPVREYKANEELVQSQLYRKHDNDHPATINRPAFAGRPSIKAQYAILQDRWNAREKKQ